MQRYRLWLQYCGTGFVGWQQQSGCAKPSVQAALAAALQPLSAQPVSVVGAGRTDAGVHATGQVAHVDLFRRTASPGTELQQQQNRPYEPQVVLRAANSRLAASGILITRAEFAPPTFHARFSAVGRVYRYLVACSALSPSPFLRYRVHWHRTAAPLDCAAMQQAAQYLVGTHSFQSFRSTRCQARDPRRTLVRLDVREHCADEATSGLSAVWVPPHVRLVSMEVAARSFLHHQVRMMAAALLAVGSGCAAPQAVRDWLQAEDMRVLPVPAVLSPDGLYLTRVLYAEDSRETRESMAAD